MNRSGRIALLLAALAVGGSALLLYARPEPNLEGLTIKAQFETQLREDTHRANLFRGLMVLGATALLYVAAAWIGAAPHVARACLMVVAGILVYLAVQWFRITPDAPLDPELPPFPAHQRWAVALVVLIVLTSANGVGVWFAPPIDGFSLGAIALAFVVETVLFIGWVQSPQVEPGAYFFTASCLPMVLIGTTLLVHRLQRPV